MICHHCLSQIPDDSTYCDQCGVEIMICPTCGRTGKAGYCFDDGTKLVHSNKEKQFTKNKFFKTARIDKPTNKIKQSELKLINKNINIEITIDNDSIIGREFGRFADIFNSYNQVSAKHLFIKESEDNNNWIVVDLNSSNGTKLNGEPLTPGSEYQLNKGDFLTIANIEFYVS